MAFAMRVLAPHFASRHAVNQEESLDLERQELAELARDELAAQILDGGEPLDEHAAHAALAGAPLRCAPWARLGAGPLSQ